MILCKELLSLFDVSTVEEYVPNCFWYLLGLIQDSRLTFIWIMVDVFSILSTYDLLQNYGVFDCANCNNSDNDYDSTAGSPTEHDGCTKSGQYNDMVVYFFWCLFVSAMLRILLLVAVQILRTLRRRAIDTRKSITGEEESSTCCGQLCHILFCPCRILMSICTFWGSFCKLLCCGGSGKDVHVLNVAFCPCCRNQFDLDRTQKDFDRINRTLRYFSWLTAALAVVVLWYLVTRGSNCIHKQNINYYYTTDGVEDDIICKEEDVGDPEEVRM